MLESLEIMLHCIDLSIGETNLRLLYHSTGKRRYNIKIWKTFTDCFNCLPVAAIIDEKIFCMHGGLSPDLNSMEQIRRIMRPTDVPDTGSVISSHPQSHALFGPGNSSRVWSNACRSPLRSIMVGPGQGHHGLGRQ